MAEIQSKTTLCGQCPWRKSNHGKRSKAGFYRKDNLRRLWNQVRNGGAQQSCHLTDTSHPDHVAAGAPANAEPLECAGSLILVQREIQKMKTLAGGPDAQITPEALTQYFQENPRGLSRRGAVYWLIQRTQLAGVPFLGAPSMPVMSQELVEDEDAIGRLE